MNLNSHVQSLSVVVENLKRVKVEGKLQFLNKSILINQPNIKDQIILATGRGNFGRFLGVLDFFKGSPLWNNENKSCLNDIKFWDVSGNLKTSKFWKLQLSISCGTQKSAKMPQSGATRWSGPYLVNFNMKYVICI